MAQLSMTLQDSKNYICTKTSTIIATNIYILDWFEADWYLLVNSNSKKDIKKLWTTVCVIIRSLTKNSRGIYDWKLTSERSRWLISR